MNWKLLINTRYFEVKQENIIQYMTKGIPLLGKNQVMLELSLKDLNQLKRDVESGIDFLERQKGLK